MTLAAYQKNQTHPWHFCYCLFLREHCLSKELTHRAAEFLGSTLGPPFSGVQSVLLWVPCKHWKTVRKQPREFCLPESSISLQGPSQWNVLLESLLPLCPLAFSTTNCTREEINTFSFMGYLYSLWQNEEFGWCSANSCWMSESMNAHRLVASSPGCQSQSEIMNESMPYQIQGGHFGLVLMTLRAKYN